MCFCCLLNWSIILYCCRCSQKGCAFSHVMTCVMLRKGNVIQFHIKGNIACICLLCTVFNTIMWKYMVMKSLRFIFFQLKREKNNLHHLEKKKIFLFLSAIYLIQMVVMSLVAWDYIVCVQSAWLLAGQLEWHLMSRAWSCSVW